MPSPLPFREALANLLQKQIMPTSLGSAELQQLDATVRRQSLFSARTTIESYLDDIKRTIESVINPVQDERGTMVGFNPATAREELRQQLRRLKYQPDPDDAGGIKDLSSDARLNLVVRTNTELAQGAGSFVRQNADPEAVNNFPALELIRLDQAREPRDWNQRWIIAAQVAHDPQAYGALGNYGRMAALKSSAIWQALGDGAGGYDDTLGNPYPPFAFNSGMWTRELSRREAVDLGLITADAQAPANPLDLTQLFRRAA